MANEMDLDQYFNTAVELAREAGKVIIEAVGSTKRSFQMKSSQIDLVTETDKQVEELLIKGFQNKFPDHRFIGEESTSDGHKCELTEAPTWIIDPIDGTMNFVHKFPYMGVSIGLAIKKEIVLGIVYNPMLNKMYSARKGKGAYCNNTRLQVSGIEDISEALLIVEVGSNPDPKKMELVFNNINSLVRKAHSMRSMGSAALNMCAVAAGEAEAYYEFGIHCWDMAAGLLIVQEAGGVVVDTEGGPLDLMNRRMLCASSPKLATTISQLLQQMTLERD